MSGHPETRMANDLAAQLGALSTDGVPEAIAAHLRRFWDPRMRTRLVERVATDAAGVDPLVVAAVRLMR